LGQAERKCGLLCLGEKTSKPGIAHEAVGVGAGDIPAVLEVAGEWRQRLQSEADSAPALKELVNKVMLKTHGIELSINLPLSVGGTHGVAAMLPMTRFMALRIKRRGVEMRLIVEGACAPLRRPDPALLKAIARAHRWFDELASGRATSRSGWRFWRPKSSRRSRSAGNWPI
jgi:site-specific DNA recombinase